MREIPILFNTPMVQAIQDGRKTMTRRVIKSPKIIIGTDLERKTHCYMRVGDDNHPYGRPIRAPYAPGDLLWVRETWSFLTCAECIGSESHSDFNSGGCCIPISGKGCLMGECGCFIYRANYGTTEDDSFPPSMFKWRPSIHMPKAAARIWLEVADVKVKKLQDITEEDAKAEGVLPHGDNAKPHTKAFYSLWQKLYAAPKAVLQTINGKTEIISYVSYPWEDVHETREYKGKPWHVIGNPWVWVVEFRRVEHD